MGELLTLADAAEKLGLSLSTVQHQAKAGRLHAEKYGRAWLVTIDEVERYRTENLGQVGRPSMPKSRSGHRNWSEVKAERQARKGGRPAFTVGLEPDGTTWLLRVHGRLNLVAPVVRIEDAEAIACSLIATSDQVDPSSFDVTVLPPPPAKRLRRRHAWHGRELFPDHSVGSLSWGAERWRPAAAFPEHDAVVEAIIRGAIPIDARYELTQHLLEEVIEAAAAIEYTVEKLEGAALAVQSFVASWGPARAGPEPENSFVTDGSIWFVYAEFSNLLIWIRALEERIERKVPGSKTPALGLLPSLAEGALKDRVAELLQGLKSDLLDGVRPLANSVLHASVVTGAMTSTARFRDGRVLLEIPDPATGAIQSRLDLSRDQGRTADGFALEALVAVYAFVDGLLDAFEEHTPERLRKT